MQGVKESRFFLSALICGFCIAFQYAIIRPVSHSVFIDLCGMKAFAYAWMVMIPLNFICVGLYNRFLPVLGCFKICFIFTALVVLSLLCGFLYIGHAASYAFGFYVWKEVYIMLFFQQLWSVVHATVSKEKAKRWYGFLFAAGALGGVLGSMIPGICAEKVGSISLMLYGLPVFPVLLVFYHLLLKHGKHQQMDREQKPSFMEGFLLIRKSSLLVFILLLVTLMQVSSALVEYQFNTLLAAHSPDVDARTAYTGKVLAYVNAMTVFLQLVGTTLCLRVLGLKGGHILIASILCLNSISLAFFPVFGLATVAYTTIKAFDFSLFGILKEMLYLPLKIEEKFQAKAVIDVFAYRTAKAIASLLVITAPLFLVLWESVILCLFWLCAVFVFFKAYEKRASKALS